MPKKPSPSPSRFTIPYADLPFPQLVAAAIQLGIEGVKTVDDLADPGAGNRAPINALIRSIIDSCIEQVAAGNVAGSVELGDRPEPFFQRSRSEVQDHEIKPQEEAIREFLGLEGEGELMLSEQDLVVGAIRASKELSGNSEYDFNQLLREGVRRVGQEMISNAVNKSNRKPGSGTSFTSPGARWEVYDQAYQKLKLEVGTQAWDRRKPYITLGYIAGVAKSNVVQIRRWAEATGKDIVARPGRDEDQTAGCLIVDDKI